LLKNTFVFPFPAIHEIEFLIPHFLFKMAGDEALINEKYEHALELYHLSKVTLNSIVQKKKHKTFLWCPNYKKMCYRNYWPGKMTG